MEAHSIVAGVHPDGLGGEVEGTAAPLVSGVDGAEVVHGLAELIAVGDGDDRVGTIVLQQRLDVRPLRPQAQWDPSDFVFVGGGRHRDRSRQRKAKVDSNF